MDVWFDVWREGDPLMDANYLDWIKVMQMTI
jgi:hypothetical protein